MEPSVPAGGFINIIVYFINHVHTKFNQYFVKIDGIRRNFCVVCCEPYKFRYLISNEVVEVYSFLWTMIKSYKYYQKIVSISAENSHFIPLTYITFQTEELLFTRSIVSDSLCPYLLCILQIVKPNSIRSISYQLQLNWLQNIGSGHHFYSVLSVFTISNPFHIT